MNQQDKAIITDILNEYLTEKGKLEKTIQNNLNQIQELEKCIQSLKKREDDNFELFSPRSMKDEFKMEVEKCGIQKEHCEKENQLCNKELNKLNYYIERFETILEHQNEISVFQNGVSREQKLTVLNIQEEERQRIARDLHDTSLQNLAHLVHKIELSSLFIDQDPIRAKLELAIATKNLKSVIEEIRNTIFDLRPMTFDDLGWKDTLDRLLDKLNDNKQFTVEKDIEDISCENNLLMVTIYRVIQECLSNAVKHSGGNKLRFFCRRQESQCCVIIEDNGRGFTEQEVESKKEKHFGLSVIRERIELLGGIMNLDSHSGMGTKIEIRVPLT